MRIAGGMFGFEERLDAVQTKPPKFLRDPQLFFLNARCAIKYLVDVLSPKQVWLPSFLCCSMIDAIEYTSSEIRFFQVGYELESGSSDWLDMLNPGDLVIVIDYFGFPSDMELMAAVQNRGAFVLEDASQALLSTHVGLKADFVVYSPRKLIGVPDGGILRATGQYEFPPVQLVAPPNEWWLRSLEASIARREYDKHGGERDWFAMFRRNEADYPLGYYRMSECSEILMVSAFDFAGISTARRTNYNALLAEHSDIALFKTLDGETVPLGFPIRIGRRDKLRQYLYDQKIFPPIHWHIECVPSRFAASHRLSSEIMTIPCDQRLSIDDTVHVSRMLMDGRRMIGS